MCAMHKERLRRHGDPSIVKEPPHPRGADNPLWIGDAATYEAVHTRLRQHLGPPAAHPCSFGCGRAAAHWAYDNTDRDERRSAAGLAYSTDLRHYVAACVSCHKRFDLAVRGGTSEGPGSFLLPRPLSPIPVSRRTR